MRSARNDRGLAAPCRLRADTMRIWLAAAKEFLMPSLAIGQSVHRPILGELFPSVGCSWCLPAHAKLPELVRARSDLLLTLHVTYCGNLGWHDSYSLDLPTQLQRRVLAVDISPEVYTLALIAGGKLGAININSGASEHAFLQAALSRDTAAQKLPGGPQGDWFDGVSRCRG